jgi:hypothetical protein
VAKEVLQCFQEWQELTVLLRSWASPSTRSRASSSCTRIPWLGLIFDSELQEVSLPQDKQDKAMRLLRERRHITSRPARRRSVTRKQLDSLIGFLSFCAMVVYGGRAFLHRFRTLRHVGCRPDEPALHPSHHLKLNADVRLNIDCRWLENMIVFNGKANVVSAPHACDIRLDATGAGGLGIFIDGGFLGLTPAQTRARSACTDHPPTAWANHSAMEALQLCGASVWRLSARQGGGRGE